MRAHVRDKAEALLRRHGDYEVVEVIELTSREFLEGPVTALIRASKCVGAEGHMWCEDYHAVYFEDVVDGVRYLACAHPYMIGRREAIAYFIRLNRVGRIVGFEK